MRTHDLLGWKCFRYCPRRDGVDRKQWTEMGFQESKCFAVMGALQIPKSAHIIDDAYSTVSQSDKAILIEGSLQQVSGPRFEIPLTDENGTISSIRDRTFEYKQGELVQLLPGETLKKWGSGLYFYRNKPEKFKDYVFGLNRVASVYSDPH